MIQFGTIKSKVEKKLTEAYSNSEQFKGELKIFKKLVLENKTIAKLYWLYDELKNKKGVDNNIVTDFVNESVNVYNTLINKVSSKKLNQLNNWLKDIISENEYVDIDNIFSTDVLKIEEKIKSKKTIIESLKRKETPSKEQINLPLSTMVKIANKTIDSYLQKLNEEDKSKLIKFLSSDSDKMKDEYSTIKEEVLNKLSEIEKTSDLETSSRINETINKIKVEKFDKLNLFRLKQLNEVI